MPDEKTLAEKLGAVLRDDEELFEGADDEFSGGDGEKE